MQLQLEFSLFLAYYALLRPIAISLPQITMISMFPPWALSPHRSLSISHPHHQLLILAYHHVHCTPFNPATYSPLWHSHWNNNDVTSPLSITRHGSHPSTLERAVQTHFHTPERVYFLGYPQLLNSLKMRCLVCGGLTRLFI